MNSYREVGGRKEKNQTEAPRPASLKCTARQKWKTCPQEGKKRGETPKSCPLIIHAHAYHPSKLHTRIEGKKLVLYLCTSLS